MSTAQCEKFHRLGKYAEDKKRPVIAKMTFFKDKGSILSHARKLKGYGFSIREDFSPTTREARRQLIAFAKAKAKPFSLSTDTLRIEDAIYVFDNTRKAVVLCCR